MATAHNILTVRDLIEALGWHVHFARSSDDELSDYWHLRFELLSQALGLPTGWSKDHTKTPRMLEFVSRELILGGFFSGFMEYTFLPGEMQIYKAHAPRIGKAEYHLRERMVDYAEELILTYWSHVRGKSVPLEQLVSMGLPASQPDRDDF